MEVLGYARALEELTIGKRLPQAVYLHIDGLAEAPPALRAFVAGAAERVPSGVSWNVVKLSHHAPKVSFLWYPRFFEDAFPELASSFIVDLISGIAQRRDYGDENPPLLHRKEALLPSGHSAIAPAEALTRVAERFGLFEAAREIGFRAEWTARLQRLGLRVDGHRLVEVEPDDARHEVVLRHRTALTRSSLSAPVHALWRYGLITPARSFFDYGCGRGDDVRALRASGVDACGWDPYFAAREPRCEADVVNLGFVLNVIEDPVERVEALLGAWKLARSLLSIAVLIGGRQAYERHRLYRDGVLTGRGTFQKYFASSEFHEYVQQHLEREPIAVAPGIVLLFRSDEEEQSFLARRASRQPRAATLSIIPTTVVRTPRVRVERSRTPTKWEIHADLLNEFWQACLALGRVPEPCEFDRLAEVEASLGRATSVLRRLEAMHGSGHLAERRTARRDDLLVFLALNLFERRRSIRALPGQVRRDVRAFWRSAQSAQTEAATLLYSIGEPHNVLDASRASALRGIGWLDRDHALHLHTSCIDELPPLLRVYVGCAARLYGDLDAADLVKIHIWSGKLSVMTFDAFEERALPELIERVKINLRRQTIDFYEYRTPTSPCQPLYRKSRFMRTTDPRYERQVALEAKLAAVPGLDLSGFGPSKHALVEILTAGGLGIGEFDRVWE